MKEGRSAFLKKSAQKTLSMGCGAGGGTVPKRMESFFASFCSQKENLPS
jgi:hypothetical protein